MESQIGSGRIEVICGSMFSGKTEEMIRRVRRAQIAKQRVQVFKPAIDTRYAVEKVTSHNGLDVEAVPVESSRIIFVKGEYVTSLATGDDLPLVEAVDPEIVPVSLIRLDAGRLGTVVNRPACPPCGVMPK